MRKVFIITGLTLLLMSVVSGSMFAATKITLLWRTNPYENKAINELVKAFEKKNPDIKVEQIIVSWNEYEPKLSTMFASGNPPDIFSSVGAGGYADYATRGIALDQSPYIKNDRIDLSIFYPQAIKGLEWQGKILALPLGGGPSLMYYNVNLFNEAGLPGIPTDWNDKTWTWDKMVEYAKKLTKKESSGKITQFGVVMDLWPKDAYAWLWGASWFPEEAYETGLCENSLVDDPNVIKSLQEFADLTWKHHVSPTPAESQMFQQFGGPFPSGKVAMGATGAWFFENWRNMVKNRFEWSVGALPMGTQRKGVLFTDPWMIAKTSKHPKEAWEFVKFAVSKEGQEVFMKGYVSFSLRRDMFSTVESKVQSSVSKQALREAVLGAIEHSQESSNHRLVNWAEIENLTNAELDRLLLGKASAKEVISTLKPKLDKLLQELSKKYSK